MCKIHINYHIYNTHHRCRLCCNFSKMKYRAKQKKLDFSITHDDLTNILTRTNFICALCGDKLDINEYGKKSGKSISWDRIDSKKGYTLPNIQPVHWHCNRLKMDLDLPDFMSLCKKIFNNHKNAF